MASEADIPEDPSSVGCERRFSGINPETGAPTFITMPCPEWIPDLDLRLPSFCCGYKREEMKCCDWTTYVVNQVGFGSTGLGLGFFVIFFFIGAAIIVLILCLLFRIFFVSRWEQSQENESRPRVHIMCGASGNNYGAMPSLPSPSAL